MENYDQFYAHTPSKFKPERWHYLEKHLRRVSTLSGSFADAFQARDIAAMLGLLHDLGKYNDKFQNYLKECHEAQLKNETPHGTSVPHAIHGGIYALDCKGDGSQMGAMAIISHHTGLMDLADIKIRLGKKHADAEAQLSIDSVIKKAKNLIPQISDINMALPKWLTSIHEDKALPSEFFIRMLFSCLVDADWLDTETHFDFESSSRRGNKTSIQQLWDIFDTDQTRFLLEAVVKGEHVLTCARREIYEACLNSAEGPQGVYRLTVPTGGGKTRSGMGFALRHALKYNLDRVIFAIPYTSIIDQTADVYQGIFGVENVLEHHSAIEPIPSQSEGETEIEIRRKLASENWDAPIIVTTTVQLFESIFSNKTSRCRKLHNLANSVLILDEVQTLPIHLLKPIIEVLRELVVHYGVTLVLSTATQPAFAGDSPYLRGFTPEPIEIVPNPGAYFNLLKRVEYRIENEPWVWEHVAEEIGSKRQALCVVNSRMDAVTLFRLLDDTDALHLSTLMCPAHRRDTIKEIKRRLEHGEPCRVVSTQVVEAGVDLDFPVVFRAIGPLDRIVQAAGRCNREGKFEKGQVIVFRPADGGAPRGCYATAMAEAEILLSNGDYDLHTPAIFDQFFLRLWQDCNLDSHDIIGLRHRFNYQRVAEKFRMISDDTVQMVVRYGDPGPDALLREIRFTGNANREEWRQLQNYSVSVFRYIANKYEKDGLIIPVIDGLYEWLGIYNKQTGISTDCPDPADLII